MGWFLGFQFTYYDEDRCEVACLLGAGGLLPGRRRPPHQGERVLAESPVDLQVHPSQEGEGDDPSAQEPGGGAVGKVEWVVDSGLLTVGCWQVRDDSGQSEVDSWHVAVDSGQSDFGPRQWVYDSVYLAVDSGQLTVVS